MNKHRNHARKFYIVMRLFQQGKIYKIYKKFMCTIETFFQKVIICTLYIYKRTITIRINKLLKSINKVKQK